MPGTNLTNFTRTFTSLYLEEPYPIDCLYILMHTLSITQSDHLDLLKSSPLTLKMKDSDCTCLNLREFITGMPVAPLAKVGKLLRPSFRRLTSQNWLANRLCSMWLKCIFIIIQFISNARVIKIEEIWNWNQLDMLKKRISSSNCSLKTYQRGGIKGFGLHRRRINGLIVVWLLFCG